VKQRAHLSRTSSGIAGSQSTHVGFVLGALVVGVAADVASSETAVTALIATSGLAVLATHWPARTTRMIEGGIGHNLPQEAPAAFTAAIIDVGGGAQ
jgi:hypothetical protein